jgi:putative ABC transport system permease protein
MPAADIMTGLASQFARDLTYGLRSMRRAAVSSATAIVVLALGVGANAAVFSVINKVLLEPLPYPAPDRLVQVFCASPMGPALAASVPKFVAWREQRALFQHVAATSPVEPLSIAIGGAPEPMAAVRVSADYFPVFGIRTIVGRVLTEAEDVPGGPRRALISHRVWRQYFHGSALADRTLVVENDAYEVIGVVAPDAPVDDRIEIWLPLQANASSTDHTSRLHVVARLRPGVSAGTAAQELREATDPFHKTFRDALGPLEFFTAAPLRDVLVADARPTLMLLFGAVLFVLLIACANVANLLLTRGSQRRAEIATRVALGASRGRIVRQLLTESGLLAAAGGLSGLALGYASVHWLLTTSHEVLPLVASGPLPLDWRLMTFTLGVIVLTTLIFGLYPALHGARVDLASAFRPGSGGADAGLAHSRVRSALVVVQMVCAVVLLVGAGLMIRTLLAARWLDRGFDPHHVLTVETLASGADLERTTALEQFVRAAEMRLETSPAVAAAAVSSSLPLEPAVLVPFVIDRRPLMGSAYHGMTQLQRVSPRYFDVFRIRLLVGRTFTEHDNVLGTNVAIVNATFARKYWPGNDPLHERVTISRFVRRELADPSRIIVGVVADVRDTGLNHRPEPMLYVPVAQVGDAMNAFLNQTSPLQWAVRTTVEPGRASGSVQRELRASRSGLLIGRIRTMEEILAKATARSRFITTLLTAFAAIALSLAAIGLYGLLAYSVQQRTREFGVRMALGADASAIRDMVLWQGIGLALLGVAVGCVAALALNWFVVSLIYGVAAWDPIVFIGVILLLNVVATIATLV